MRGNMIRCLAFFLLLPAGWSQQISGSPSPLVAAKVSSAKKIFVSNLGADRFFSSDIPGGANVCYNEFYTSLKQWGHFDLVDDPTHADLILAIECSERVDFAKHFGRVADSTYDEINYPPLLNLAILEPGAKAPLNTISALAGRGSNVPKGEIALADSIDGLTTQLMAMVGETVHLPAPETLVGALGPVPPQMLQAKSIFLRIGDASGDVMGSLTAALKMWGHYVLVDSPEKADLIFEVRGGYILAVDVYTVPGQFQIWTVVDPNFKGYSMRPSKQAPAEVASLMKAFKALAGEP